MSTLQVTLSIIVPAYNEGLDVKRSIQTYVDAARNTPLIDKFEIFAIDDGSSDDTYDRMLEIASKVKEVTLIKNSRNLGLSATYKKVIPKCMYEYVNLAYGFTPYDSNILSKLYQRLGRADIISGYISTDSAETRGLVRYYISRCFVQFLNIMFRLSVYYYNGQTVFKKKDLLSVDLFSTRSGAQAEIIIKLMAKHHTIQEVELPQNVWRSSTRRSSSSKSSNYFLVLGLILHLFFNIYIKPLVSKQRIKAHNK